jgi:hypothetical protein
VSVAFPILPRGTTLGARLVRYGGDLVSVLGGPTQRIARLGSRYLVEVQLPTLDAECAGRWLGAVLQAEARGETVTLTLPQMNPVAGLTGGTGTGAVGASEITYAGAAVLPGTWFSFFANGRNYLHLVTAQTAADTLAISPRLRAAMPAATLLEFAHPKLEGYCDDTSWSLEFVRFVGHTFTLTESA